MTKIDYDIRSENRYVLGPLNKKRCRQCEVVYDGIKENFHIHKHLKTGTVQYTNLCKTCQSIRAHEHKVNICQKIETYAPRLLVAVRNRAKTENIVFDLTKEHLIELWNEQSGNCYYTGLPMQLQAKTSNRKSPHRNFPSLDKKNPSLGYVKGNVAWTLYGVNRMKNDYTEEEFVNFCELVLNRRNSTE